MQVGVAPNDPQGLKVGMSVTISPDVDGGEQPVDGKVRYADAETIGIERTADEVGAVCVHFPVPVTGSIAIEGKIQILIPPASVTVQLQLNFAELAQ